PLKFPPPAVRAREPVNGTAPTKLICPPAVMSFPTGVESAVASSDPDRLRVAGRVKVPPALTLRLPETAEPAVNVRSPLVWTVTSVAWSTLTVPRETLSGDLSGMLLPAGVFSVMVPDTVVWTIPLVAPANPRSPPVVSVNVPPPTVMLPTLSALASVIDTALPMLTTETEAKSLPAFVRITLPAPASNVAEPPPVIGPVWVIESAAVPPVFTEKLPGTELAASTTGPVARRPAAAAFRGTDPPHVFVRLVTRTKLPAALNDDGPPQVRTEFRARMMSDSTAP